ncbi:hypothetical protein, partial [Bacillus licheniformis]|uniref:hypothetical protein n=1 Tax=Bacillus licheniformis TaxID=1402 RepID=UPI00163A494A
ERVSRGLFSQELSDRIKSQYHHIMDSVEIVYVNEYVELAAERALEEYFEDKLTLEEALTKAENDVRIILNE